MQRAQDIETELLKHTIYFYDVYINFFKFWDYHGNPQHFKILGESI